jgi:hypothetical protein
MTCHPERSSRHPERSEGSLRVHAERSFAALRMTVLLFLAACASPEAGRPPGAPGADVHNRGDPVEFHAGAQPYYDTPCVTEPVECHGPPPVFGPTPPPD